MYRMKNIVPLDSEVILPKCMYSLKKITEPSIVDEMEIDIRNQQAPPSKMSELEERQDLLLKKLDILYDKIKTISSYCKNINNNSTTTLIEKKRNIDAEVAGMEEIVIVLSPDSLPWFLNLYLKQIKNISVSWHIHSSVPSEKKPKIYAFFKKNSNLYEVVNSKINIRLIFKPVAADSELKLTSLDIPIVGIINVIRYLALIYPTVAHYDINDYQVDSLLDLCCLLERAPEKNKEALVKNLFSQQESWIYGTKFSIVDLAVYNIVKQWQNSTKYVPKAWFQDCENIILV